MALTVLCLSFVIFLLLGVPVAFAIGLSCLATFAVEGLPFETAIQMMVSGMNVFSFLAIPFFIFSSKNFLSQISQVLTSGQSKKLVFS